MEPRNATLAHLTLTTLLAAAPREAMAQTTPDAGTRVARWKTWILASATEVDVPASPAEGSDQTKAESNELRLLQALRFACETALQQARQVAALAAERDKGNALWS